MKRKFSQSSTLFSLQSIFRFGKHVLGLTALLSLLIFIVIGSAALAAQASNTGIIDLIGSAFSPITGSVNAPDSRKAALATLVVSPSNLQGWTTQTGALSGTNTSTQQFENGPGTPPLGIGSFGVNIGPNGDSFLILRNTAFDGVRIDQLNALSYSTYVTTNTGSQAHAISLEIDTNNDSI